MLISVYIGPCSSTLAHVWWFCLILPRSGSAAVVWTEVPFTQASYFGWKCACILMTSKLNVLKDSLIFETKIIFVTSAVNKRHCRKAPLKQGRITMGSSYKYIYSAKALWGTSGVNPRFVIDFCRNTLLEEKNQTNPLLSMYLIYGTGCTVFSGASQVHNLYFTLMPLCEFMGCQKLSIRVMELCLPFGGYNIFFKERLVIFT